jgi:energy-coupling factor transport system substrate-specific component
MDKAASKTLNKTANKLKTKDLIVAGAFAALYIVVLMVAVSALGFITPITYLMAPFFVSIPLGVVYMLYVTKVPKTGAIMILAVLVGLITGMNGMWFSIVWALALGLVAELLVRAGKYRSVKLYQASFCVFAATNMAPFWGLILAKPTFLAACTEYYNAEYAAAIDALTPWWIVLVLVGIAVIGGIIGSVLGRRLLKKHFEKAGVV